MKKFLKSALIAGAASMAMASPAFADWYEIKTDQFIVYSAAKEKQAVEFAELMERFDRAMRITQNIPFDPAKSDAQRVTVFHWGDGNDIAKLATGVRAAGVRGFYIPRAGNPVAYSPIRGDGIRRSHGSRRMIKSDTKLDPISVLKHEYVHSFMLQHFPATYPAWYVEGFAEFYGQTQFLDDGSFHLGNPPQYRSDFLKRGPNYHVEKMFETDRELTGLDQASWYAFGWLLIHHLTFSEERKGQLEDYLLRIQKGESSMEAAKAAFGDLDKLNSDVQKHLKRDLPGYNVKPAEFQEPEVTVRKLTEAEEDVIEYRMRSWRGVDEDEAEKIQSGLRSKADLTADSVIVAMTVAEAEYDAEDYDAAERAAQRALDIDPMHSKAHLYLGRIDAAKAEDMHDEEAGSGATLFDEARAHFLDAYAADKHDPLPLFEYYQSFKDADQAPNNQALVALETAYVMAPYDRSIRATLVRQLASEGKAGLAADLMTPIVFAPHGNEDIGKLREAMEKLRSGEEEEGLAMIEEQFREWEWEAEQEEDGE